MADRVDRETPAAMTVGQAAEAVQETSPEESAAIEREQNQMFSSPGQEALQEKSPAD